MCTGGVARSIQNWPSPVGVVVGSRFMRGAFLGFARRATTARENGCAPSPGRWADFVRWVGRSSRRIKLLRRHHHRFGANSRHMHMPDWGGVRDWPLTLCLCSLCFMDTSPPGDYLLKSHFLHVYACCLLLFFLPVAITAAFTPTPSKPCV